MKAVKRLGWWLLDYLYAGWRQLLGIFRPRCPAEYARGDGAKPAIVLLPGVYETWFFLEPAARRLNASGFRVFGVPQLGHNGRAVPDSAAIVARALSALHREHGVTRCIFVAHSKGGLIGKHAMLDAKATNPHDAGATVPAPSRPVEILGLVAIATPFSGSLYARYMLSRTLRHFSPEDAVLMSLQAQLDVNEHAVSIYPEFDPHIPGGSALPGAVNIELPIVGHFRTLGQETLLGAVDHAVAQLSQRR
ncbi:esterase/lipase family protein [Arthrobacter sp. TMN-49]